ncbi:AraC family transcriptional regulator [Pandoraea thiooxydans]|uniref:AraC family transcriptional regulator n=1 Tax=Pandoraea thiooxydans TaxID=445709 RepID=A0A0G3EVN4_9BURK|nr:AraC family transcriptional regulator [Pandoraea thiooxydans]AKJ69397.1 AraC family transcriptional regulator [Pandoraea thiooxydans]APR97038.1 AraC family transcriptional regulator [Pandoraea thiooxydans]
MTDPLAEVVTLLQPTPTFSKVLSGAGRWRASRTEVGQPFYCVVLEGSLRLSVNGREPLVLQADDFILVPEVFGFTMTSIDPPDDDAPADIAPTAQPDGSFRFGDASGAPDAQWLAGLCAFGAPDAALLVSLLPELALVRGDHRLAILVKLVRDESRAQRPAREVVLARLLEVLFIEALRSVQTGASPGLVRGLSDARLALAIREIHKNPEKPWTIAELAKTAALSRSSFFDRFSRAVGVAPMAYLLSWRMAIAKNLLRQRESSIATIAARVGYGSASAFSVAFARHVGVPPTQFAQQAVKSVA